MIKKLLYEEGYTIKGAVNFIDKKINHKTNEIYKSSNEKLIRAINLLQDGSNIIKKNLS